MMPHRLRRFLYRLCLHAVCACCAPGAITLYAPHCARAWRALCCNARGAGAPLPRLRAAALTASPPAPLLPPRSSLSRHTHLLLCTSRRARLFYARTHCSCAPRSYASCALRACFFLRCARTQMANGRHSGVSMTLMTKASLAPCMRAVRGVISSSV